MPRFALRLALSLLGVTLCFAPLANFAQAGAGDRRLEIYWIDVEGGAATLIVTPAGESVLIDTGNPGQRDAGRIVEVAGKVAGLREINHLIVTHYHGDHYGGASFLAKLMPIRNLYDNGEFAGMPEPPPKEYLSFECERRVVINPGDKLALKSVADSAPLELRCLGTRQTFVSPANGDGANAEICATHVPKERDGSDNANSVVMLLSFGGFRFLDAGDLTWNQEQKLVCPKNLIGKVDVYQTTHHGLDVSNNPVVVRSVEPRVAIFNNGATKGTMPEVFATLKATPSLKAIYQMHRNERKGDSEFNVPDEYIANGAAECRGNFLRLSVDPAGKTYTISIPANKHERTYETR